MNHLLMLLLFLAVVLAPLFIAVGFLAASERLRRKLKNPLTQNLRRPPGGTLHRKLQGAYFHQVLALVWLAIAASLPICIHLFQSYVLQKPESRLRIIVTGSLIVGICVFAISVLLKGKRNAQNLALGYECELAVGQELDQLMLKGYRTFHDLEGKNFNVDHVLVGPGGVFAIETKGKSKVLDTKGGGKTAAKVQFVDGVFRFPKRYEENWAGQAKRQAAWIRGWLSKAVGFDVFVQPVVVVPGWYVETKSPNSVKAIGSGQIGYFFSKQIVQPLTQEQVDRIAYQLDQKTRDIEPGTIRIPLEGETKA